MTNEENESIQDSEKLEIIKWLTTVKDRSIIDRLKKLRDKPKKTDWWNGVSEDQKKAFELGNLRKLDLEF
jgi:hypothetical protein